MRANYFTDILSFCQRIVIVFVIKFTSNNSGWRMRFKSCNRGSSSVNCNLHFSLFITKILFHSFRRLPIQHTSHIDCFLSFFMVFWGPFWSLTAMATKTQSCFRSECLSFLMDDGGKKVHSVSAEVRGPSRYVRDYSTPC